MTTAYLRVSSDKQTTQNQRFEIEEYAKRNGILVDEWVEEVISGTKHHSHRKLGRLIKRLRKDDTLILSELSRLSRNLMGIFSVLNVCMERGVRIIAIKERYELGNSIEAKGTCVRVRARGGDRAQPHIYTHPRGIGAQARRRGFARTSERKIFEAQRARRRNPPNANPRGK